MCVCVCVCVIGRKNLVLKQDVMWLPGDMYPYVSKNIS